MFKLKTLIRVLTFLIFLTFLFFLIPYGSIALAATSNNTSYNMKVLVIKYFPLTPDGQNIDINVTGDVGGSYSLVKQLTIDVTNNLVLDLPKASSYLRYKNASAAAALNYQVIDTKEFDVAVPIKAYGTRTTYPDYNLIMTQNSICNYVDTQGVQEVWLWAYQGPSTQGPNHDQPFLGISESKMSGPYGDISNSPGYNEMPLCQHTYRVYTFNYGRGTSEAMESWGHQMEFELDAINQPLFRNIFQGPNYPQTLGVIGRCGSVHNPPNARSEYDRANSIPQNSDCIDWNPDGLGILSSISCQNWGCNYISDSNNPDLNYMIWNWQNLPGRNNTKYYQGKILRNWWDVHGDFDNVMGFDRTLFMVTRVEDNSTSVSYTGTWNIYSDSRLSGGQIHYSKQTTAVATFNFIGSEIKVIMAKAPNLGKVKITLDGSVSTVDLYNAINQAQKTTFFAGNLGNKMHTIKISPTGTKNIKSTDTLIDLDAFDFR